MTRREPVILEFDRHPAAATRMSEVEQVKAEEIPKENGSDSDDESRRRLSSDDSASDDSASDDSASEDSASDDSLSGSESSE